MFIRFIFFFFLLSACKFSASDLSVEFSDNGSADAVSSVDVGASSGTVEAPLTSDEVLSSFGIGGYYGKN